MMFKRTNIPICLTQEAENNKEEQGQHKNKSEKESERLRDEGGGWFQNMNQGS